MHKLDGHRIHIDAVDAVANHVAEGLALSFRWRLLFPRPHGSQSFGDAMRGGDQKMAATAGGVNHLQLEDRGLRLRLLCSLQQDRIESGVEQAGDQARRCVVAAGLLALATGGDLQFEAGGLGIQVGMKLQ